MWCCCDCTRYCISMHCITFQYIKWELSWSECRCNLFCAGASFESVQTVWISRPWLMRGWSCCLFYDPGSLSLMAVQGPERRRVEGREGFHWGRDTSARLAGWTDSRRSLLSHRGAQLSLPFHSFIRMLHFSANDQLKVKQKWWTLTFTKIAYVTVFYAGMVLWLFEYILDLFPFWSIFMMWNVKGKLKLSSQKKQVCRFLYQLLHFSSNLYF